MEIWKDIIGYEGYYQISNLSRIKSLPRISRNNKGAVLIKEKILRPSKNSQGYYGLKLKSNCVVKYFKVHRLIAIHFIPNNENKPFINHINGIKHDNRIENLEWCTRSENCQHAHDIGLQPTRKGDKNGNSKLTENQVLEIRKRLKNGESNISIATLYNIGNTAISKINLNKTWKHI